MTRRSAKLHSCAGFRQRGSRLLARLFPERQIVLRTGQRRRCFTVSTNIQAAVAVIAAGTALWQGLVTSEWLDSTATIAYKDYQIVDLRVDRAEAIESMSSSEVRLRGLASRISTEIEDIQRNLALLARHDSMTSKPVAAYTSLGGEPAPISSAPSRSLDEKLARLEESLRSLKSGHAALLATSAKTASVQLDRLESALATVGINSNALIADAGARAEDSVGEPGACEDDRMGRGGPFIPMKYADAELEGPPEALHATMQRWDELIAATSQLPLGEPVENMHMHMTSRFGRRLDPFNRRPAVHAGIDYAGLAYTPVVATGGGVVSYSGRNGRYGKLVQIDHGHGFVTRYAHLAEISVTVGQKVERGTEVGLVGSTGRSTGPHLHYELRVGNEPRDPLKYIGVGKNVFQRNTEGSKG